MKLLATVLGGGLAIAQNWIVHKAKLYVVVKQQKPEKRNTAMKFTTFPGLLVGAFTLSLAYTAIADPTHPVSVEAPPTDQGTAFVPGVRLVDNLPCDYVFGGDWHE